MSSSDYYIEMVSLAQIKRAEYGVATGAFGLREMRVIYKSERITLDLWPYPMPRVRAAYLRIDGDSYVVVRKGLPVEPRLFSLAHELKHHFVDMDSGSDEPVLCATNVAEFSYDRGRTREIGAEVFAAEFIFPESEFRQWANKRLNRRTCTPEEVVHLKMNCPARVSYAFILKRLERVGLIQRGQFIDVKFHQLQNRMYPRPY